MIYEEERFINFYMSLKGLYEGSLKKWRIVLDLAIDDRMSAAKDKSGDLCPFCYDATPFCYDGTQYSDHQNCRICKINHDICDHGHAIDLCSKIWGSESDEEFIENVKEIIKALEYELYDLSTM